MTCHRKPVVLKHIFRWGEAYLEGKLLFITYIRNSCLASGTLLRCLMNDWKGQVRIISITAKVPKERKNPSCYFVWVWIMLRKTHHFGTIAGVFPASSQFAALTWVNSHPNHAGPPRRPPMQSEKTLVSETLLLWKAKQAGETVVLFRLTACITEINKYIVFFLPSFTDEQ